MASRYLDIFCGQCENFIVRYKKEGSGQLIRLYLDKILEPKSLACLKSRGKKTKLPPLACHECNNTVGNPMEHDGHRLAYRMIRGSFIKSTH